jgi:hypothetical protein
MNNNPTIVHEKTQSPLQLNLRLIKEGPIQSKKPQIAR